MLSHNLPVSLSHHMQIKAVRHLHILFLSDHLVLASDNTVQFGFFAIHEIVAFSSEITFLLPNSIEI